MESGTSKVGVELLICGFKLAGVVCSGQFETTVFHVFFDSNGLRRDANTAAAEVTYELA